MRDELNIYVTMSAEGNISGFTPEDAREMAERERQGEILMGTILTGKRLGAANAVLIRWGFEPMAECSLNEIMSAVSPMQVDSFVAFAHEIRDEMDTVVQP